MRPPARHRLGPVSALIACVSERAGERLVRPQSTLYNALLDPVSHAQSRASRKARGRPWRSGQGRGKRPNGRTGDGARLRSDKYRIDPAAELGGEGARWEALEGSTSAHRCRAARSGQSVLFRTEVRKPFTAGTAHRSIGYAERASGNPGRRTDDRPCHLYQQARAARGHASDSPARTGEGPIREGGYFR